ncbi:probable ADP-ribosylation factor GTPase-activating protein AGD5 isoform X2 [Olea europaea var. sylvestris]|nr:probable ADP-ribosylation factor GTPase-activating protein AGD5 isoform X2 [Olea europaea var. sylvestris]
MPCSGIHRSLGVHISKVRSATLDTWLPEQVAFIQSMGNEKSNSYWEAELPPNYDRVGIENFIRAKYEEKRWIPKDGKSMSPVRGQEEKASSRWQRPTDGNGYISNSGNSSHENFQAPSAKENIPAARVTPPMPPKGPEPIAPAPVPQQVIQKPEQSTPAEPSKQVTDAVISPKVDYATDLFNMLSMDGGSENALGEASADDISWAGFQSASTSLTAEKTAPEKPDDNKTESVSASASGIEDLFKDSPSIAPASISEKPQKDVKNDIMSLFEKSNMVSPFALHQQQIAMLAQQQSILMAAAANSSGGMPKLHRNTQVPNGANLSNQSWPNVEYQFPGMMMPAAGKSELEKYMQMGNMAATHPVGNSFPVPVSSMHAPGPNTSSNGSTSGVSKLASSFSSASPQTGKDYDFSSLTQGWFSKH